MRFEDEPYSKLYRRETPTMLALSWQARAVWHELLKKFDYAGLLECGPMKARAVSLVVRIPFEVVGPALKELEELELVRWTGAMDRTLEAPRFNEAQEARKTKELVKKDFRERAKAHARSESIRTAKDAESLERDGTNWNAMEPTGTNWNPPTSASSSTPTSTSASLTTAGPPENGAPPVLPQAWLELSSGAATASGPPPPPGPPPSPPSTSKTKAPEASVDPLHAPLLKELLDVFEKVRGAKYPWNKRIPKTVQLLRATGYENQAIATAWKRCLVESNFPQIHTLEKFLGSIPQWVGSARKVVDVKRGRVDAADAAEHGVGDTTKDF